MRVRSIYPLIALAIVCMATSSIIIRYSTAPAMIIALYRVIFTSFLAALLIGRKLPVNRPKVSRSDLIYMGIAGIFLALHFGFWITSLSYTSIPSSVLFTNLQVVFVLLFSAIFLKEGVNLLVVGGIVTAIGGSVLIAYGDLTSGKLFGDLLALLSGFFIAVYFIIGRYIRKRVAIWPYTFVVSAAAAIVLISACISAEIPLSGYPFIEWILFFLLALGPGIVGHGILNWSLKYVKAPIVAVSILGESVGASILAYLLFSEILLWYQIIGGVFVLLGIYFAIVNEPKGLAN